MQRPGRARRPARRATRERRPRRRRRRSRREPSAAARAPREPTLAGAEHLGAYAPLIGAIRDELEHFVASHVRLHLGDRRARPLPAHLDRRRLPRRRARRASLLQQFMREFKPEQVKRYLAREVIGGLPNAAAIDLSQFAGLVDAEPPRDAAEADDGEYRELLAALRTTPGRAGAAPVRGERARPLERGRRGGAPGRAGAQRAAATRRRRRSPASAASSTSRTAAAARRVVLHGGRAGAALRRRQGRGLRHPRRRHLRQPAPCRDLARGRRLVGGRRRLDQRHARRARRRRRAAARRRDAGDGDATPIRARRRRCASSFRRAPRARRATTRGSPLRAGAGRRRRRATPITPRPRSCRRERADDAADVDARRRGAGARASRSR